MTPAWHSSFDAMRQRPHVLVVCPQAVGSAWGRVIASMPSLTAWQHQQEFARWFSSRKAGLLAAEMGTGKTLSAIMALGLGQGIRHLDLCSGPTERRAALLQAAVSFAEPGHPLLVTVNYEAVWRNPLGPLIESIKWAGIVLDESHRIKSPGGRSSRWLAKLATRHPRARRLCLTGTPMPHDPLDLYGQFRFLDPSVFGTSFARMRAEYAICDTRFPSKVKAWKNQDRLAAKLREHSWRVTSEEVLDLPDAIHETVPVVLSKKTMKAYRSLEENMIAEIEAGTVTASNGLTKLLRMSQATGGYLKIDDSGILAPIDGTPSKALALCDRLEDLPPNEPVVVFCRFRSDLEDVSAIARNLGREYAEVSGERKDLERWQAGDAVILGVQMQSGGVGIDCSRAAFAFYYSLGYSLGDYEQSLARLRRPGQSRCVRYYHLVCEGTVDEAVYAALRGKREVVKAVMDRLSKGG